MISFWLRLATVIVITTATIQPSNGAGGNVGRLAAETKKAMTVLQGAAQQLKERGARLLAGTAIIVACANLSACDLITDITTGGSAGNRDLFGTLPIMQGATTADQTQLFIMTDAHTDYLFTLTDSNDTEIQPSAVDERSHAGFSQVIQRVLFEGLSANTPYRLQVHAAASGELLDERELRTLAYHQSNLRFVIASCMLDIYPQGDIWEQMVALSPDVIFLLGDNVYTDLPDPVTSADAFWRRYTTTRSVINLFKNRKLIPVISTWDDHDYGTNNSDRHWRFKQTALDTFKTFFISDATNNYQVPEIGVASFLEIYDYSFFLMDNRMFRTALGENPQRHFGDEQLRWLLDNLRGREHAFIASGDQFFGGYAFDATDDTLLASESFQGTHPDRFAYFISQLRSIDTDIVFLSGDRHFTEVMEIPENTLGYQTYEFTSSPVGTLPLPLTAIPNPLRVAANDTATNFMLIEVRETGKGLNLQVSSRGQGGKTLYKGKYKVE